MKNSFRLFFVLLFSAVLLLGCGENSSSTPRSKAKKKSSSPTQEQQVFEQKPSFDPLNTSYTIEGQTVTIEDGQLKSGNGNFALWGAPAMGDLDNDTDADAALVYVQNSGTTSNYYVVAAIRGENDSTTGTNGIALGSNITPRIISSLNGRIQVHYLAPNESGENTKGVTRYFFLKNGKLEEEAPAPTPSIPETPAE